MRQARLYGWARLPSFLAGNGNGLVQLGLQGSARGPTVKRRERGNRPCLSAVVRGADFGFSFHTSSPGWPGSLWANTRYAWLQGTSSSAPIRIGTVMGVALSVAMFSIAACACISRAKGTFGMYFNLGDQKRCRWRAHGHAVGLGAVASICIPTWVKRYCCRRLLGFSGRVIFMCPRFNRARTCAFSCPVTL